MTQIRVSEAAGLLGVSDDTVRRWIDDGRIAAHVDAAGRKVLAGSDLAALAVQLAPADDDPDARARSARNHLAGIVTAITSDVVMSQVELQCGPHRVVSLISTEAVRDLGLEVGSLATAVVKATHVTVETRRGRA